MPYLKLSADAQAFSLSHLFRKTRMLLDEKLTAGQRNSLATGNSLMQDKRKHGLVRLALHPIRSKKSHTLALLENFPRHANGQECQYSSAKGAIVPNGQAKSHRYTFRGLCELQVLECKGVDGSSQTARGMVKDLFGGDCRSGHGRALQRSACFLVMCFFAETDNRAGLFRLKPQFAAGHGEAGREAAPVEQEMTEDARRALTALGAEGDDDDDDQPKAENDTADDAELRELEGDEDDDMEEVPV